MNADERSQNDRRKTEQFQADEESFSKVQEALHQLKPIGFTADTSCYVVNSTDKEISFQQIWQNRTADLAVAGLRCILPSVWEVEIRIFAEKSVSKWLSFSPPKDALLQDELVTESVRQLEKSIETLKFDAKGVAKRLFSKYKEKSSWTIVQPPQECLPRVLERFSKSSSPFNKTKKTHEFADAFALEALEHFSKENDDMLIVVASNDADCINYCRSSERLVGFWSIEKALDALTSKERIEELLARSVSLSMEISMDPTELHNALKTSLLSLAQLSPYEGYKYHSEIPPQFHPYISIEDVLDVKLLPIGPHGLLVRVQSESPDHLSVTGRVAFKVVATGHVNALSSSDPDQDGGAFVLFSPSEYSFELDFYAIGYPSEKEEGSGFPWFANVDDGGKPIFSLRVPSSEWEPVYRA